MRIKNSIKLSVFVAGLWLGAMLPSTAFATPTQYNFSSNAVLTIASNGGGYGNAQAVRPHRSTTIRFHGASVKFNPDTSRVSAIRVRLGRYAFRLNERAFRVDQVVNGANGGPVFLRLVSASPRSLNFTLALGVAPVSGTQVAAANPVPEPTAAMLFGAGLLAVSSATRRNRKQ